MRENKNRRNLLKTVGAIGFYGVSTGLASGTRRTYPIVKDMGPYAGTPVRTFAAGAAEHPSQDRIAVVTAAFGDGFQLYIADGASSTESVPDEVYQITDDAQCGAFEPNWLAGNRLEYVVDFERRTLKIPPSYVVLEHKTREDNVLAEDPQASSDSNTAGNRQSKGREGGAK